MALTLNKKHSKNMTNDILQSLPKIIGMPWFEAESFHRVKAIMSDADQLHGSHAAWLLKAQSNEEWLRRAGKIVYRVPLDTARFAAWCAASRPGLNIDAQARADYAAFVAAQMHRELP